jgi:hypothetical protein
MMALYLMEVVPGSFDSSVSIDLTILIYRVKDSRLFCE